MSFRSFSLNVIVLFVKRWLFRELTIKKWKYFWKPVTLHLWKCLFLFTFGVVNRLLASHFWELVLIKLRNVGCNKKDTCLFVHIVATEETRFPWKHLNIICFLIWIWKNFLTLHYGNFSNQQVSVSN